jgi:hypothetical protein
MGYSDGDAMGRGGKTGTGRMASDSQVCEELCKDFFFAVAHALSASAEIHS